MTGRMLYEILTLKWKNIYARDATRSNCIVCWCAYPSNRIPTETKAADQRKVEDRMLIKNVTS